MIDIAGAGVLDESADTAVLSREMIATLYELSFGPCMHSFSYFLSSKIVYVRVLFAYLQRHPFCGIRKV
jgi:hypothetical protein